jgi:hypothetical protein
VKGSTDEVGRTWRLGVWALPAFVFTGITVILFVWAPKGTSIDYAVYHRAGGRFLRGEDLYRATEFFSLKYAPVWAAFFAPLSLLPQPVGWLLFNACSVVVLLAVMRWASSYFEAQPRAFELALVLAMMAPYYGHLLWLGQTDALLLGLLVASEAQAEKRPVLSGILWALACMAKPSFLVLLLEVAVLRQWKRLLGLAAGIVLWLAAGSARFSLTEGALQLQSWVRILVQSAPGLICWEFNQSLFAIVCTYFAPLGTTRFAVAFVALVLAVVAAGLLGIARISRAQPTLGRFALGAFSLYLGALFSPLGWNTQLVAAIPLAVALASIAATASRPGLRQIATRLALVVILVNCVDLLLLPLGLWPDTMATLLYYRQYGIAGLILAGSSLACLAVLSSESNAGTRSPQLAKQLARNVDISDDRGERIQRQSPLHH